MYMQTHVAMNQSRIGTINTLVPNWPVKPSSIRIMPRATGVRVAWPLAHTC